MSEVLQKSNLRLGMEFLGPLYMRQGPGRDGQPRTPFIWTLPETVALAKDCGPNMGAVLDVWHWHHSGGTIADILAAGGDRIVHVHISDAKPAPPEDVRDNQRFMPGEGSIDLDRLPPGAQEDRLRGRREPGAAGANPAGDVRRGRREAGARHDAGRDEEGGGRVGLEKRTPLDSQHVHT